jgi:hypothetical protein
MRAPRRPSLRLLAAALLAGAGTACGGDGPTTPTLARLALVALPDSVVENESVTWRVTGRTSRDAEIATGTVEWSSSDTTVAVVSPGGVVTARRAGQALIAAAAGTVRAQATVRVTPGRVAGLFFLVATDSLPLRSEARFSAEARDAQGRALRSRTVAWRAADTTIAVVGADGRVTPRALGQTQIVASADDVQAGLELVVREPLAARVSFTRPLDSVYVGQRDSVVAVLLDSTDAPLKTIRPRYATSDAAVLSVDATGHVRGMGAGTATVTASGDGRTRTLSLSVRRAPIDHIFLAGDTLTLFPGATTPLGASVRDLFGIRVSDRAPTWRVEPAGVVELDADGTVTARRTGSATVTATVERAVSRVVVRVVEPTSEFQPEVRFVGPTPSPIVEQQIRQAMGRWQSLVVGDLPDITIANAGRRCGYPDDGSPTFVDDLLVVVEVDSIDGPGQVLGAAGPCLVRSRTGAGGLTAIGIVTLDSVDVSRLAAEGRLIATMQHEMGHILGLGTLWAGYFPLSSGIGGADPRMTGFRSRMAASTIGVTLDLDVGVPLENIGGEGTRDGHWRESVFGDELMTGFIGRTNPMSILTVQAMADLGYLIDVARAEPYLLGAGIPLFGAPGTLPLLVSGTSPLAQLFASGAGGERDVVLVPELEADARGVVRSIAPRPGSSARGAITWRAARRAAAEARRGLRAP